MLTDLSGLLNDRLLALPYGVVSRRLLVLGVESLQLDVTINSTRGEKLTGGVESNRVNGTEVALHGSQRGATEDLVEEFNLELGGTTGGGHILSLGTTTNQHVVGPRSNASVVDGDVSGVGGNSLQATAIQQLSALILRGGDDGAVFGAEVQLADLLGVGQGSHNLLLGLNVHHSDGTIIAAEEDVVIGGTPLSVHDVLGVGELCPRVEFGGDGLLADLGGQVEQMNGGLLAHLTVGHAKEGRVVVAESYATHGGVMLDAGKAITLLDIPQVDAEIETSGGQHGGGTIDVATSDGLVTTGVGSQALTGLGVPAGDTVGLLRGGEEQVTFPVELDHGDGLHVPVHGNGVQDRHIVYFPIQ